MEAVVLAGGLGTRLRSVVADVPKAMASVGGRPFLEYLLDMLVDAGFASATLAVGFRSDAIRGHFGEQYRELPLRYSIEDRPLGTGGAIRLALSRTVSPNVFVFNGDTLVDVNLVTMAATHRDAGSHLTVAVHAMADASRYGAVDLDGDRIRGFREKGRTGCGWINAGVYLISRDLLQSASLPETFSFESDFLVPQVNELQPLAFRTEGLFIDIGVPEDYARAQVVIPVGKPAYSSGSRP